MGNVACRMVEEIYAFFIYPPKEFLDVNVAMCSCVQLLQQEVQRLQANALLESSPLSWLNRQAVRSQLQEQKPSYELPYAQNHRYTYTLRTQTHKYTQNHRYTYTLRTTDTQIHTETIDTHIHSGPQTQKYTQNHRHTYTHKTIDTRSPQKLPIQPWRAWRVANGEQVDVSIRADQFNFLSFEAFSKCKHFT